MPLPPLLKRKDAPAARSRPVAEGAEIQQARVRARRRLIGAAVLLVIGVIAFPLLFETQPRTIPVDIPIEAARNSNTAPVVPKPGPPRVTPPIVVDPDANVVVEAPAAASGGVATAPVRETANASASAPALASASAPAAPKDTSTPKPKPTPSEAPKEVAAATPASGAAGAELKPGRFVIQVGAFADGAAARDVRLKVERLGLKTYTQIVDTDAGKRTRVRVGPFDSREEAAQVLGRLKTANLPGAVLAL